MEKLKVIAKRNSNLEDGFEIATGTGPEIHSTLKALQADGITYEIQPVEEKGFSTFEAGKTYFGNFIGNSAKFTFEILRRTAKSVWIEENGKVQRRAIETRYDGSSEQIWPFGKYSMAASLCASKIEV